MEYVGLEIDPEKLIGEQELPDRLGAEGKAQAIITAHPDIRWERRDMTEGCG